MQELTLETRICDLQEYLELTGFASAEQVFEDFGVVAQEYAYTVATLKNDCYIDRCFEPIVRGNYEEAVARTVASVVKYCHSYLDKK